MERSLFVDLHSVYQLLGGPARLCFSLYPYLVSSPFKSHTPAPFSFVPLLNRQCPVHLGVSYSYGIPAIYFHNKL